MGIFRANINLIPANDKDRLRKLYRYDILDTPQEDAFDKIARLAMSIFDVPKVDISFVDKERVFFKSIIGEVKTQRSVPREDSLSSWAILQEEPLVLSADLLSSLIVNSEMFIQQGIGFYAAAPIQTADGYRLGTLSVAAPDARYPEGKQIKMLSALASVIMDELEFRLTTRKAIRVQTDLMNIAVHDLKNPLTSIRLYAQMIQRESTDNDTLRGMAERISKSTTFILQSLNDLLNLSQIEDGAMRLKIEPCALDEIFRNLLTDFEMLISQKGQRVVYENKVFKPIAADKMRLKEIFENLLSNASKYAYPNTLISISIQALDNHALIAITDQGQGLSDQDKEKLFKKFARLSAIPTGKEGSNGLGLSIVKTLVELHNGKIWAESEGKEKGTTFYVSLPFTYQEKEKSFK